MARVRHRLGGGVLWRLFSGADVMLAETPAVATELEANGFPRKKVVAIPPLLEAVLDRPLDPAQRAAIRAEIGLPDRPIVLFVGRLVKSKGVGTILEAWPLIAAHHDAALVLVGDGPLRASAEALARSVDDPERIRIVGSPRPTRDELLELYDTHPFFQPEKVAMRARRRSFDRARLQRLERWTGGPGSLLAMGAMEGGWVMDNARRRGWDVVGVEFITSLFESEAARNVEMIHSPMWDLDVLDRRHFDAIHTLSLEHVYDILGVLGRFRELLNPGGIVVIESPNQFEGLKERLKLAMLAVIGDRILPYFQSDAAPYFHLSYFTPRTLREAMKRSGFEVLESRTYLPWNPIYQSRRQLRTLREASFVIGSLLERGPSIEVIARPTA